jgi:hypothetical protein
MTFFLLYKKMLDLKKFSCIFFVFNTLKTRFL